MSTSDKMFSITGGPSLMELFFSLFDDREGLCSQDSVVFQAESNSSTSEDMPQRTIEFRCCIKSLHRLSDGNITWRFKATVINLDVKKEVRGEYNCQTRKGFIKSTSEIISERDYKPSDTEQMRIVIGPDRFEFASALVRGNFLTQRIVNFQLKENNEADIKGWDAKIWAVERIDFSDKTWAFSAQIIPVDAKTSIKAYGWYSTTTKEGVISFEQ